MHDGKRFASVIVAAEVDCLLARKRRRPRIQLGGGTAGIATTPPINLFLLVLVGNAKAGTSHGSVPRKNCVRMPVDDDTGCESVRQNGNVRPPAPESESIEIARRDVPSVVVTSCPASLRH